MIIIAPSSPKFIKRMARKPISPNRMPKVLLWLANKILRGFWPPNFVLIQMWWIFYDTTVKLSDEWMYGKTKGEVLESKKKFERRCCSTTEKKGELKKFYGDAYGRN